MPLWRYAPTTLTPDEIPPTLLPTPCRARYRSGLAVLTGRYQVDMYSYGVVLSELVTGEKPYAGLTQMQIAFATVYQVWA